MPNGTPGVGGKPPVPPSKPPIGPVRAYQIGTSTVGPEAGKWSMAESFEPLNADRYVAVGYAQRSEGKLAYPVLDIVSGQVALPEIATGGDVTGTPKLVHYDAQKGEAGLFSGIGDGAKQYQYAHWDLGGKKVDWTVPLGPIDEHTFVMPVGADPKGQYFYFLKESRQNGKLDQYHHAESATIGRVDLKTHQIDWTHDLPLPGRSDTFMGALSVQPNADYSKFAVLEYGAAAMDPAAVPPQGFVVDVAGNSHTTLTAPLTPYGVTFDRDSRYLAIASNVDSKLHRFDVATGREDMVVGTVGRTQTLAISSDNAHLYVFTKGRTMEVRDWPSMKLAKTVAPGSLVAGQTHFNGEGMAVLPDGKHAVMTKTEAPYGFPDEDEFFSVGLGESTAKKP